MLCWRLISFRSETFRLEVKPVEAFVSPEMASTVIGLGDASFVWSGEDGIHSIAGGEFVTPTDVSFDGSVIVGLASLDDGVVDGVAWSATNGFSVIPFHSKDGSVVIPNGVSGDGLTVVGSIPRTLSPVSEAFRWTAEEQSVLLTTGDEATATETSFDGSIIVGKKLFGPVEEDAITSYRWTELDGFVPLGDIEGGASDNSAIDVSPSGNVIVGIASVNGGGHVAYRWTAATGMVGLGDLDGGDLGSTAWGVSADGNIVVGTANTGNPRDEFGREAFIWDSVNGMRNLQHVLETDFGLSDELDGWTLFQARDISDDGRVIIGTGINPDGVEEAWVAVIPEPTAVALLMSSLFGLNLRRRSHPGKGRWRDGRRRGGPVNPGARG